MDCLASADAALLAHNEIEWIVVDNDSQDQTEQRLQTQFPFVQFIQMGYNAGFARANNAGIKVSKGAQILLLNPDTILLPGSILECLDRFIHSSHIACGVQLVHADLRPQFSASFFMKGGVNHLLSLPYWGASLKAVASLFIKNKPAIIQASATQRVDWVSGAFLMVKKTAIEKAGLLDEDFFLYAEEVEWCSRLHKMGSLVLYGDLSIIHLIGTSIQSETNSMDNSYTNLSDKKGFQLMVSNHLRIRKQYGIFWFLFQLLNYSWTIVFAFVMSTVLYVAHFKSPIPEWKYLAGFANNLFRLWAYFPKMLFLKKHFYKCI